MFRRFALAITTFLTLGLAGSAVNAQAQKPAPQCFLSRDWQGWKPSADSRAIYIRVGLSHYYRIDFSSACPELQWTNAHLITKLRGGGSWICDPLDLDIEVAQDRDPAVPCIARKITPLTKDQVAAVPKNEQP